MKELRIVKRYYLDGSLRGYVIQEQKRSGWRLKLKWVDCEIETTTYIDSGRHTVSSTELAQYKTLHEAEAALVIIDPSRIVGPPEDEVVRLYPTTAVAHKPSLPPKSK